EKIGCDILIPKKANAHPSSVIYEAAKKAKDQAYDLLIIDTAGRLQNKVNLMNELKKMYEVLKRFLPEAANESLLVFDATNGQSGIMQAKVFKEVVNLSGIILTKM
ncbi:signal recognition particle-docking protein FtsY, partial [Mycoplasmopsis synoviae]